jgi:hypothetical protein
MGKDVIDSVKVCDQGAYRVLMAGRFARNSVGGFHNLLEILFLLHCMRYPKMKKDVNRMKSFVNAQITIVLRLRVNCLFW